VLFKNIVMQNKVVDFPDINGMKLSCFKTGPFRRINDAKQFLQFRIPSKNAGNKGCFPGAGRAGN